MKLCKDCMHCIPAPYESYYQCVLFIKVSLVAGNQIGGYCSQERADPYSKCGPDGKLFEPRKEVA